jgi:xanthine dehydrogenase small subunit
VGKGGIKVNNTQIWIPKELQEAWERKTQWGPDASYVAGGTWLQVKWQSGDRMPAHLISLEQIPGLRDVQEIQQGQERILQIGALATLGSCRRHPAILANWPLLSDVCVQIAAPAVRSRATIGGNIANGSGDMIPALVAMDTDLIWFEGKAIKLQPIGDWLEASVGTRSTSPHILTGIRIRKRDLSRKEVTIYKKVGRREAFIPALISVAACGLQNENDEIKRIRLAVGGGDNRPQRLRESENFLRGKVPDPGVWRELHYKLLDEIRPASDCFASADYRRLVAANLLVAELMCAFR